jgi:hypothetical protein
MGLHRPPLSAATCSTAMSMLVQRMVHAESSCFLEQHLSKDAYDGPLIYEQIFALAIAGTQSCCRWQPAAAIAGGEKSICMSMHGHMDGCTRCSHCGDSTGLGHVLGEAEP